MSVAISDLIHPTAVIAPEAEIAPDVQIGPYAIIEGPVRIGPKALWKGDCRAPSLKLELGATVRGGYFVIPDHSLGVGDLLARN